MEKLSNTSTFNRKAFFFGLVLAFFMKSGFPESTDHSSKSSPLIPIILNVQGIAPQLGIFPIAELTWNPSDPLLPGYFYIERLEPSGWNLNLIQIRYTAGKTSYLYDDVISSPFCVDNPDPSYSLKYRIRFEADDGINNSASNTFTPTGMFADLTNPVDVANDTVSIYYDPAGTLTGRPVIGWNLSTSNDVAGYIIQRNTVPPTTYTSIGTVPAGTTFYVDTSAVANDCSKIFAYAIVTLDKCGKRSPGSYGIPDARQTISLTLPKISSCERKAHLTWTPYYTMPGGLGGYKVYRNDNLGVLTEVYDTKNPSTLLYTDSYNFISGHLYTYFVRAYSTNGLYSSSSCLKTSTYMGQNIPDTVYIMQVSVENDSYIKLDYMYKPDYTVNNLQLERRDSPSGQWVVIDSASETGIGNVAGHFGSFIDTTARVHNQSYTYRLTVVDSCKAIVRLSFNTATSIYLEQETSATDNRISWNMYDTWLKGIDRYDIFRRIDGIPATGVLALSVSGSTNSFSEPSTNFDPKSEVCYWVVAHENAGNQLTSPLVIYSKSNIRCIEKDPTLFMPNAFTPEGIKNNRLRPVVTFVDPGAFKMIVFDRWGREIFETTDIVSGWDGSINGQIADTGLYSYLVTYKAFDGREYIKRGTASIIR